METYLLLNASHGLRVPLRGVLTLMPQPLLTGGGGGTKPDTELRQETIWVPPTADLDPAEAAGVRRGGEAALSYLGPLQLPFLRC